MTIDRLSGDRIIQQSSTGKTSAHVLPTIACFLLAISWMDLITVIIGYDLVSIWVSSVILIVYMIFGKTSNLPLALSADNDFGFMVL